MRIDLHTHSNVSDGTDAPGELVAEAASAGLSVVAITDHDTFDGWAEATGAAGSCGVTVVPGVEMSTRLEGASVHLLAYLPDSSYAPLADELERIRNDRFRRIPAIAARLTEHGWPLSEADVQAQSENVAAPGRPHVADAMIAKGYVRNRREAFDSWLSPDKPGYVPKYAPQPARAIRLVREAGGVPVVAHPWSSGRRAVLDEERIATLAGDGLAGLEADHVDHDDEARRRLRGIAEELDLIVTGSSDYHGAGKVGYELGTCTTAPEQYERLVELAESNAESAGREASRPAVPRPDGAGT